MDKRQLIADLQSQGLNIQTHQAGAASRKGGAGPSDHKAITIDGTTVMIPVHNDAATKSEYTLQALDSRWKPDNTAYVLSRATARIADVKFPQQPNFYRLKTADGIPYSQIALLHSHNVLATTVLQTCIRYRNRNTACQFCAIEQSLEAGKTITRKSPEQLAEVAEAAVTLDGVEQLVMTTGTPNTTDRGAAYLVECAKAIKARVDIPIQAQCEPPDDFAWFISMKAAGIDSLGMHLEVIEPEVRDRIMPGKAKVSLDYYFEAFAAAVEVFGRGEVSTYILAGLGDSQETIMETCERLIDLGVYPFVVPFVPISGTPLVNHPPPNSEFMVGIYQRVGAMLNHKGLFSQDMTAGCAKCGACSALSTFENYDNEK